MLWLGLQVAQGKIVWSLPTLQCNVLYLSLEDTRRRIKDRLYSLTDSAPDNLYFAVTFGLIGGGLEEQITGFLTEHPATKLVIIDTLQKVRDSKGSAGKAGMYGNDYDDISSIKKIADEYNIAILLVHRLRKLKDSNYPFNDVSGSTGIIGAADANFVLRHSLWAKTHIFRFVLLPSWWDVMLCMFRHQVYNNQIKVINALQSNKIKRL